MIKFRAIIFICIFHKSMYLSAMIIPNGSENEFRIGDGIRLDTEQRLPTCLTAASINLDSEKMDSASVHAGSVRNLKVRSEIIRSRTQLDSYSRQNTSLKVRYLAMSGTFKYSSEDTSSFSKDQVMVGLSASVEYERKYLSEPKLARKYKQIAEQDMEEFFKQCGHEYVSGIELGQGINVILKSMNSQALNSSEVNAKLASELEGLKAGASLTASVSAVAQTLIKYSQLEVQIFAYGLGGLPQFGRILTDKKDVEELAHDLGKVLAQVDPKEATVTSFLTSPYGEINRSNLLPLANIKRLSINRIVDSIIEVADDANSLKSYLAIDLLQDLGQLCDPGLEKYIDSDRKYISCLNYINALSNRIANLSLAQDKLISELRRCMDAPINDVCDSTDLNIYIDLKKQEFLLPSEYKNLLTRAKYRQFVESLIIGHQDP